MTTPKICVECQKNYAPRCAKGSQEWAKQKFCCQPCSIRFRKRLRNKRPIPEAVLAECKRQNIPLQPDYDTISFRNLEGRRE